MARPVITHGRARFTVGYLSPMVARKLGQSAARWLTTVFCRVAVVCFGFLAGGGGTVARVGVLISGRVVRRQVLLRGRRVCFRLLTGA